ncbi:MAG: IclR family transcriptional regulator [Rhodobacteraceae bacterium]|nr:MAG: IclR family transcriptional regulator [Paracoccaceae bacterium]
MTLNQRDIMGGLAKGLAVIETFSAERPRQSIAEVSAASGYDRATTRRCLLTLAHQGYADYDGKYFTLTPRVLRLGTACLATMPLPQIVQPMLDKLSDDLGESTSVSILDGSEIVYVARAAQRKVMSISLTPGSRLPAFCTSMGRVLLAALPPEQADDILRTTVLEPRTKYTVTDIETLASLLDSTRINGFALIDQEIELGLRSIAVPLFNTYNKVIGALNIGLPVTQDSLDDLVTQYLAPLQDIQQNLKHHLR